VWSWRTHAGAKFSRKAPKAAAKATVATKLAHRGEREVSRKPLRREGRCDSACTCGLRAFAQPFFARRPTGTCGHPVFPAPSVFKEGEARCKNSGAKSPAGIRRRVIFALRKSNGNFLRAEHPRVRSPRPACGRAIAYGGKLGRTASVRLILRDARLRRAPQDEDFFRGEIVDSHGEGAAKPRVSNHEARHDHGEGRAICDCAAASGAR
jgi:hypothetical protein